MRPELQPLREAYTEVVRPRVLALEHERRSTLKKAALFVVGAIALGIYLMASGWVKNHVALIAVIAGFGFVPASILVGRFSKKLKSEFSPALVRSLGWSFDSSASTAPGFDTFKALGVLPSHDTRRFEDRIAGTHFGTAFEMVEMHLTEQSNDSETTVFRGFTLAVDFHQPFTSTTLVVRDRRRFNPKRLRQKGGPDLKRVGMASPKWEKMFEAYGTDQVEARVKLDPAFMERLMHLADSLDGKVFAFGFFDNCLYLLCRSPNRFEPGSPFRKLDDDGRYERFETEIAALMDVIEGVTAMQTARP